MPFTEDPLIEQIEQALMRLHRVRTAVDEAQHLAAAGAPHQWIHRETRYALADLAALKELLIAVRWPEGTYSAGQVAEKRKRKSRP
jgi:hypothetical protein